MQELIVKQVDLFGDTIVAAQDKEGNIWAGVSWFCKGIGLNKGQKDTQVEKIQTDRALKTGCRKFPAGVFDANNEVLALKLDYVPIWLAKISITQSMEHNTPDVAEKLLKYQLKAKDVLAEAFIEKKKLPQTYLEALKDLVAAEEEKERLKTENATLIEDNTRMKPKEEFYDTVTSSKHAIDIGKVAKILDFPGIGRNKLFEILRNEKILMRNNVPYQKYIDRGYFRTIETKTTFPNEDVKIYVKTLVYQKGVDYIRKILSKCA